MNNCSATANLATLWQFAILPSLVAYSSLTCQEFDYQLSSVHAVEELL